MKTVYLTRSSNIVVDKENNDIYSLNNVRQSINNIFLVKEPMHIIYGERFSSDEKYKKEFDVEKGDLIVTFYESNFPNKIIVIKNKDWVENITTYEEKLQKEKELWAANSSKDCEACNNIASI